jgi:hypothetical protein
MKRLVASILALLLAPAAALAMDSSAIPPKFPIVWGNSAGSAYIRSIPEASQIGVMNCAASLTDGFPPLTFTPSSAGGCPPFGQDFNGILKQVTQWSQWVQAGGPVFYDSSFATSIGGYPKGTILSSTIVPGYRWLSTVENNTTDPDAGGAGWVQDPGQVPTGTPVAAVSTTIPYGYVSANGTTIGNGSSNATGRANADTQFLFTLIWNSCSNAICPIYTSGGAASSRGATAAADYAANKALAVWNMNGSALMGADSQNGTTSTNLSNVPVTSGSRTAPGSVLGENLHTLVTGEIPSHNHSVFLNDPGHTHAGSFAAGGGLNNNSGGGGGALGAFTVYSSVSSNTTGITVRDASGGGGTANQTATTGGGGSHNTVPRSTITYWNLKL